MEWKSILSLNSSVLVWARVALIFFTVANVQLETALVIQGYFSWHWEALRAKGLSAPHHTSDHQQRGWGGTRSCEGTQLIPAEPFQSRRSWRKNVSHSDPCCSLPHPGRRERGSEQLWESELLPGVRPNKLWKMWQEYYRKMEAKEMIVDHLPATGGTDFLTSDFQARTALKCIPHRAQGCCFNNWTIDYTLHRKSRFIKEPVISFRASGTAPKVISISQA